MATLRLAANYIETMGAIGLNWGHLQLVHGSQEIEVQAPYTTAVWAEGEYITFAYPPERTHLDPDNTTGTLDPTNTYSIIDIDVGDRNPDLVWDLLNDIHDQFRLESPNFLYGLGQNSNSYIATLLWMIGIDLQGYIAAVRPDAVIGPSEVNETVIFGLFGPGAYTDPDYQSLFPGADLNILTDGYGTTGELDFNLTLTATAGDDFLRTGTGNDFLNGAAGNDEIFSGSGDDILIGGAGNDLLNGGEDNDWADYSATADPDASVHSSGIRLVSSPDTVVVHDGIDTLISIENIEGTAFDDTFSFEGGLSDAIGNFIYLYGGGNGSSGD